MRSAVLEEIVLTYVVFKDVSGEWCWRLRAANTRIIAVSGESYHNKADCKSAIELVKSSNGASVVEV
ncbi:YegP family protein [Planctomicrobium sp. SH661]|uniref:YegP family protein n=1 Tax=Planctomicrobium sp. SH661 TaxID=3448124 RepID=UPI003F5C82C3